MSTNATAAAEAAEAAAEAAEAAAKAAYSGNQGLSFGPFIMSFWIDCVLFGVMCVQIIQWFTYSRNERWLIRGVVYHSVFFTTFVTFFTVAFEMHLFAYGFGTYVNFTAVDWLGWYPLLDSVVSTGVQVFYVDRAYRLNGNNKLIIYGLGILIAGSLSQAITVKVKFSQLKSEADAAAINYYVWAWLSTVMAADIFITILIGFGLYRSQTGWSQTDKIVKNLIMLTVETQLAPTLVSIGFLIEFLIEPASFFGVLFETIQSKFYVVGLLIVLNSRYNLRRQIDGGDNARHAKSNTFAGASGKLHQDTINVTTETYVESFTMQPERMGRNRDPAYDLKDILETDHSDGDVNSTIHNLDYRNNGSKAGLTDPSDRV